MKPILIAEGLDASALYEHTRACEMRSALVEAPLKGGQLVRERVREILGRHQIPVVASGRTGSFDTDSIHLAYTLGASKYIALLNDHKVPSRDGHPIAAILESEVAGLSGELTHRELLDQAAEACRAGIPRAPAGRQDARRAGGGTLLGRRRGHDGPHGLLPGNTSPERRGHPGTSVHDRPFRRGLQTGGPQL